MGSSECEDGAEQGDGAEQRDGAVKIVVLLGEILAGQELHVAREDERGLGELLCDVPGHVYRVGQIVSLRVQRRLV